jgi:hypothetical protein
MVQLFEAISCKRCHWCASGIQVNESQSEHKQPETLAGYDLHSQHHSHMAKLSQTRLLLQAQTHSTVMARSFAMLERQQPTLL